jgi:hypothetical protein
MLVPEYSNLSYVQLQVLTYALDKQNDLPEYYLQIPCTQLFYSISIINEQCHFMRGTYLENAPVPLGNICLRPL